MLRHYSKMARIVKTTEVLFSRNNYEKRYKNAGNKQENLKEVIFNETLSFGYYKGILFASNLVTTMMKYVGNRDQGKLLLYTILELFSPSVTYYVRKKLEKR